MFLYGAPGETRTPTPYGQQILSLPRLPIPPRPRGGRNTDMALDRLGGDLTTEREGERTGSRFMWQTIASRERVRP